MAMTGHTSTLTFGTSGFTAAITEIGGQTYDREALKNSTLATANYHGYQPGDLVEPGELTVSAFYDPNTQPPITGAIETITRTYPDPPGLTNGATKAQSGFVKSWSEPTAVTDQLMTMELTIQFTGAPTFVDAS